jgi:DNA-binding NtrC family response regulator
VRSAGGAAEALEIYHEFHPDLTFMDVKMARMDGLEALTTLREMDPSALVVMISGHGTIDTAVEATRRGAYDFLEKPLDTDRILLILRNALQQRGLLEENARLRGLADAARPHDPEHARGRLRGGDRLPEQRELRVPADERPAARLAQPPVECRSGHPGLSGGWRARSPACRG